MVIGQACARPQSLGGMFDRTKSHDEQRGSFGEDSSSKHRYNNGPGNGDGMIQTERHSWGNIERKTDVEKITGGINLDFGR